MFADPSPNRIGFQSLSQLDAPIPENRHHGHRASGSLVSVYCISPRDGESESLRKKPERVPRPPPLVNALRCMSSGDGTR